ncbi:DUF4352 domain-containing protein [Bacillus toyonensis]|uniref:DUF4352 domain-containing protein n=1 Tax=Bacillus toyonensis TaxID=155322 RepID=UPI000CD7E461|nr:DUF4352 domain-containing protein [Bacillus toyonensis]MED3538929.1 DUF4352 domain-containing protein [Bacillus toyonensis]MEE2020962.1 DUF4352 domain-containing protein [Bacillus toyonensis]
MKKPFYKKWWFWVIVVIIVLGAYGNSNKDKEETKTASTEPKQEVKQETKKDEPKKDEAKKEEPKKELSKEGESSKVNIAVGTVETLESVGSEHINEKAQGVFKVVELTLTNNQKDAITLSSNSFKLVDNQDREFSPSSAAQIKLNVANGGNSKFLLEKLNPGLSQTGKIVFDVPKDAQGLVLKARGGITGKEITLKLE